MAYGTQKKHVHVPVRSTVHRKNGAS